MKTLEQKINEAMDLVETTKNAKLIAQSKLDDANQKLKDLGYNTVAEAEKEIVKLTKKTKEAQAELEELEEDLEDELKAES